MLKTTTAHWFHVIKHSIVKTTTFIFIFILSVKLWKKAKRIICLHQHKLPICASLTSMLWLSTVSIHVDSKLILQCDIQMHTFMVFFLSCELHCIHEMSHWNSLAFSLNSVLYIHTTNCLFMLTNMNPVM